MSDNLQGAWVTHNGLRRDNNEDAIFFGNDKIFGKSMAHAVPLQCEVENGWLIGVADGVGGHNAGEAASRLCVEGMSALEEALPLSVERRLTELNREIYVKAEEDESLAGMGTTVAGVGMGDKGLFAFNVGDSRVYKFSEEKGLERVTIDDSLRERGAEPGQSPSPFAPSNVITQALGGRKQFKEITPNLDYELDLSEETLFLICSDGLSDMVTNERMEQILQSTNATLNLVDAANALLEAALDGGGRDNVSIVLGHYVPAEEHKPKPLSVWKKIFGVRKQR